MTETGAAFTAFRELHIGESAAAGSVSITLPKATGNEAIINRTEKSTTVKVTVNKDGNKSGNTELKLRLLFGGGAFLMHNAQCTMHN